MTTWTRPTLTGQSLAERVHNVNRTVNALWARNIPETKVMVGRTATGWWLSHIDKNGCTVRTEECANVESLMLALAFRWSELLTKAKVA